MDDNLLAFLFGENTFIYKSEIDQMVFEFKILSLVERHHPRCVRAAALRVGLDCGTSRSLKDVASKITRDKTYVSINKMEPGPVCAHRARSLSQKGFRLMRSYFIECRGILEQHLVKVSE